jgi:hypothetical protein
MDRRAVIGGSLVAGLSAVLTPGVANAASPSAAAGGAQDLQDVSSSINRLDRTLSTQFEKVYTDRWQGVLRIRQQQHLWMRSTQKFPDFIEVGIDVWDNIYDWHVVHQQPLAMNRTTDGRYAMVFMFTTLLLRAEQAPDFVGFAFDANTPRPR